MLLIFFSIAAYFSLIILYHGYQTLLFKCKFRCIFILVVIDADMAHERLDLQAGGRSSD